MNERLKYAAELLKKENYTLVLYNGTELVTSKDKGIKPLLDLYNQGKRFGNFSSADLVMGKAVAFLYVLLGVKEIFAPTASEPALEVLRRYNIKIEYEKQVPFTMKREGTGICPMEQAVLEIDEPDAAYKIIQKKWNELKKGE